MAKRKRSKAPVPAPAPAATTKLNTGFGAMSWDQQIVWVCLHLLLFFVPVAMGNLTFLGIGGGMPISFDQFDIVKLFVMRATTIVAIGAWVAGILLNGGKIRRTKIDWFILAFLLWVLISSFFSIHVPTAFFGKYRRFEGWLSFLNYALVYFLIVQVADRMTRIRSLMRTFVVSSMFVTGYGLMQYFGKDIIQWGKLPFELTRSFSTYGNPDLLGGFLVLAAPIAAVMALSEPSKIWRAVYWIATLMVSAVLITAFTRGAWIGAFAALVVLVIAAWRAKVKTGPMDWGFAGVSVLAVVIIVVRSLTNPNQILNFWARLTSIFQFGEGSAASRFEIWEAAINAIKMRPIMGFGADTFRLVFPFTKTEAYVQQAGYLSVADNVHNYPLQLMAGIGIPGFLIMYGTIGYALYLGASAAFSRDSHNSRLLQTGAWSAVFGYMVHLIFGLSVTGSTVFLWAFMGIIMAPTASVVEIPRMQASSSALRLAGGAVAVITAVVLSFLNIQYLVADRNYLMGRIGPYDIDTRVQFINRAIALNPSNDMYRAEIGLQYVTRISMLVGQLQEQQAQGGDIQATLTTIRQYFDLAEKSFIETIDFVPPEYDNYVFLSNLYNMGAEVLNPAYFEKAIEIGKRGVEVEYYGPAIRYQLARAYLGAGQKDQAIKELQFATRVDPAYEEAKSLLVSLLIESGRTAEAREVLEEMLRRNPNNPVAQGQLQTLEASASAGASGTPATP